MAVAAPPVIATLVLQSLPHAKYRLRPGRSVVAEVEQDSAGYVVCEQSTGIFYYDPEFSRAIDGFLRALVDQFEFLRSNEQNLSPALSAELERLSSFMEPA